jgi:LmbE family N-acetylglucosaminyl deacetylase
MMPRSRRALTPTLVFASSLFGPIATARAAGPPPQPDAARIALGLHRLGVVGSVLYVAAHPDDENTALLAYLANGALVRTAYLSVTRGDGGQNLVGSEQGAELGAIRTEELLAARRIDGAEQFFTRARDFGYSKSPEETLRIWGKDAALADVVTVVRRFRPDVIITRFSPEPTDTHGHHTASAMLAVEAFRAAADPRFHPEELEDGLAPWQASRLFWNRSSWNLKPSDDMSGFIKLDVGGYSPLLGMSFGEMAADSRSMHKSQGFGIARARAPNFEYFKQLAAAMPKQPSSSKQAAPTSLFAGIDMTWARFTKTKTAALDGLVARAIKQFDIAAPAASLPALAAIGAAIDRIPDAGWRAEKQRQLGGLMLACAGVFAEAIAPEFSVAPGGDIDVTATAINRSQAAVTLEEIAFPWGGGATRAAPAGRPLPVTKGQAAAELVTVKRTLRVPADASPSVPYWLDAPPDSDGVYHVADAALVGRPESPPAAEVGFTFAVAGRRIAVSRAVAFKWTDPVAGERYRPLEVTPVVSVSPDTPLLMFPGGVTRAVTVKLTAGTPGASGRLRPEAPAGWVVEPAAAPFALAGKGSEASLTFQVRPPPSGKNVPAPAGTGPLRFVAEVAGSPPLARGVVRIVHDHIPIQTLLVDAKVRLVPLALATGGTRIGYFPGPGDEVPASLRRVGYEVGLLGDDALAAGAPALARWDAIVIGVRAFNTNERLRAAHAALMSYVEGGGVLVVQYNTNNRIAPLIAPLGPWPFDISQKRVTDETAAVAFAPPTHPALTTPNKIDGHDFEGWVQERGLYFADKWDPRYDTPLAMHDAGEPPLPGGLLWARHGKGVFVYTGLAFFRQLPAGVPGAYRLFANLLAGGTGRRGR